MHEQSETVTRPSGSVNVYGGTQFPLPKVFGFEKNYYPSQSEAVNAAQWRSRMGGGPEEYQDAPSYGFKDKPIRTRTRLSWVERWTRFKIHVWVWFLALGLLAWASVWRARQGRWGKRWLSKKVTSRSFRVWD